LTQARAVAMRACGGGAAAQGCCGSRPRKGERGEPPLAPTAGSRVYCLEPLLRALAEAAAPPRR